jgi:hypothetical protein
MAADTSQIGTDICYIHTHVHTYRLWIMTPHNLVEIRRRFGKATLYIFINTVDRSSNFEKGECSEAGLHRNCFENIGKARKGASVIFNIFAVSVITLDKKHKHCFIDVRGLKNPRDR